MEIQEKITAKEIRNLNIKETDILSLDYQWCDTGNGILDHHFICVNSKRVLAFNNSLNQGKAFNRIKRMGFGLGWKAPQLTDEEKGIIQAAKNGENPFAYSIICANPKYNKIVK